MIGKSEYPNIEALIEKLSNESEEFDKQLDDVKKMYSLVALAYGLQKCMIKDLSVNHPNEETPIEALHIALTREKWQEDEDVSFQQRMQQLERCIGIAGMSSYVTLFDCLTRYGP